MTLIDRPDALAAMGVLQHLEARDIAVDEIGKLLEGGDLVARLKEKLDIGTARLRLDPDRVENTELDQEVTEALEEMWRQVEGTIKAPGNRGLRLELGGAAPERLAELVRKLEHATGADSLVVVRPSKRGRRSWRWPLRIGLLVDLESELLRHGLQAYGHQNLIELVDMENWGDRCDLMMLPNRDRIEVATDREFSAGFVVVFVDGSMDSRAELAARVAELIDTAAVAIVPQPDTLEAFLQEFLDELSHNFTPDIALSHANWHRRGQLVLADPSFLDTATVTGSLAGVQAEFETATAERRMSEGEFHDALDELEGLNQQLSDIGFLGGWGSQRHRLSDSLS